MDIFFRGSSRLMEGDEFSDLLDKLRGGNRFTLEEFSDDEPLTA
jgi:hypothetical protein